jgi:hypothetical protein
MSNAVIPMVGIFKTENVSFLRVPCLCIRGLATYHGKSDKQVIKTRLPLDPYSGIEPEAHNDKAQKGKYDIYHEYLSSH